MKDVQCQSSQPISVSVLLVLVLVPEPEPEPVFGRSDLFSGLGRPRCFGCSPSIFSARRMGVDGWMGGWEDGRNGRNG